MKLMGNEWRRKVVYSCIAIAAMITVLVSVVAVATHFQREDVHAAGTGDWSTYFGGIGRSGFNPSETAINATTVPNLKVHWTYRTGGSISTQPVVANGHVYFGSWDGNEYATDLTGRKIWSTFISPSTPDCLGIARNFGVGSSATVTTVPINGTMTSVVFVGSSNAYVYALNAATGAVLWKSLVSSTPHTFLWSNAAVYNGSVYIGISSVDDCPLVQGGLAQLNASTGAIEHVFNDVPTGCLGGSVWASPAINTATGMVYIATGNAGACNTPENYDPGILALRASDLTVADSWQVPAAQQGPDSDFGATPTLFTATIGGTAHAMIGVENKNGIFYALDQASLHSGPLWQVNIGGGRLDIAATAFDGKNLYVPSLGTVIGGKQCYGSLRALNPATGAFVWQDCLGAPIHTGVSVVPGVAFAGVGSSFVAFDTATGKTLFGSTLGGFIYGTASISSGVAYIGDASGNMYAFGAPTTPAVSGPISSTWYFAEGKVGQGFTEFLTLSNPNPTTSCSVTLQYLLPSGAPVTRTVTVPAARRWTEGVNTDLHLPSTSASSLAVSTIVTVPAGTACKGVVAERPMYFTNFAGISSGTDVLGSTHTATSFSFADLSTAVGSTPFITILNPPGGTAATITATYLAGGVSLGHQSLVVQPGTRGTIAPTHFGKGVAAMVTASRPVVVEQPVYFNHLTQGNAGIVSGAASVIGAEKLSADWLFAEGYTGTGFQEHLVLANPAAQATSGSLILEYDNGTTATFPVTLGAMSQNTYDVNHLSANPTAAGGVCNKTPCTTSNNVSAEIKTKGAIVAERELFFHYTVQGAPTVGGSMLIGQVGPPTARSYSFAEGYTYSGYSEWLTLQNPTAAAESITVTLFNAEGRSYSEAVSVTARSRYTLDINTLVSEHLLVAGDGNQGYEVSMSVGASLPFVAERPMYWNAFGTQGGSTILGYRGG